MSEAFGRQALAYAVALSRASNHPVSRAMVQAGERGADDMQDVGVSDFTQVGLHTHTRAHTHTHTHIRSANSGTSLIPFSHAQRDECEECLQVWTYTYVLHAL